MSAMLKEKTPEFIKWVVSPILRNGKFVDSVWVSAMTEKGAQKNAIEALEVFGIKEKHIAGFSVRKLDDVMACP